VTLFPGKRPSGTDLRNCLASAGVLKAPGCSDALSARVLEAAGFEAIFLGGFSASAARLALPDMGLMSYGEMIDQARNVCAATSLPVLGDGDTGYGNPINAARTVLGSAQAGLASIMIEDQIWPKRCGHTAGKETVDRTEALARVRASVRAREENRLDILIMARTDAVATDGFEEALWRASAFADAGADITFLEAPTSLEQMRRYCKEVPGFKTANLVEDGKTPWLTAEELSDVGYSLAIYPVTLLLHSIRSLQRAAVAISGDQHDDSERVRFDEARALLGWADYEAELEKDID
jgi:2-methylisocitrate lyase-like PEP mutase family enzyme